MKQVFILILFASWHCTTQAQTRFHLGNPSPLKSMETSTEAQKPEKTFGDLFIRSGKVILSQAEQVPQAMQEAAIVSVQLFDDVYAEALCQETRLTDSGALYWFGHLTGGREGVMEWLWSNGYLTGSINDYTSREVYDITADSKSAIRINELDISKNPQPNENCFYEDPEEIHPAVSGVFKAAAPPPCDTTTVNNRAYIDVLVVYPTEIAGELGNTPEAREVKVLQIIEQTNTIFNNSEVFVTFRLAGHEINDALPADISSATVLWGEDSDKGIVRPLRIAYGADIFSHWNSNGTNGSGYVGKPTNTNVSYGLNTCRYSEVISRYTFAHECGHNLGNMHDRYEYADKAGGNPQQLLEKPGYQFGKCFPTYRTIMAYPNSNQFSDYDSSNDIGRIMHYSNPDVEYNGVPTGTAGGLSTLGEGGPANAAKRINEVAKSVENYFPSLLPPSTALSVVKPATLHVYPTVIDHALNVQDLQKGEQVQIYNALGVLVGVYRQADINVSHLSQGMYFVKVNDKVAKILKK